MGFHPSTGWRSGRGIAHYSGRRNRLYTFTPKPTGTRWYHSHAMAMADLSKSTYSGEFGFLIVEPVSDAGGYDREITFAAHHWEGEWVSLQDFKKGPPPNNGLEVIYKAATLNERMLGHGEPIRVREGERILFRLLNASGNMGVSLALPGHRFTVVALDGNPVPTPATVDVLKLDVAERADVLVEMNNPGVWVFGSADDMDREMGMELLSNMRTGAASQSGSRRSRGRGITPCSATQATRQNPTKPFLSSSRKSPVAGAVSTAGLSTVNPGPTRTLFSLCGKASVIA